MNKDAYAKIIKQDIEWLENNSEPTLELEREHIKTVLEESIERFYPNSITVKQKVIELGHENSNGRLYSDSTKEEILRGINGQTIIKEKDIRNVSIGWIPCIEDNYPDFTDEPVVITYWSDEDHKWYYWMFEDCPYGWNVLCRSEAYLKKLQEPIR